MVEKTFKFLRENNEFYLLDRDTDTRLNCPTCLVENSSAEFLVGKYQYAKPEIFVNCDVRVALAGVTDSLRLVDEKAFNANSVLKKIIPADELIDKAPLPDDLESARDYEEYHIIRMDRDVKGDDDSIHAYITTVDGKLRVRFPKDIRLDAKRNNRSYWVDSYKIQVSDAGGKHVIPQSDIQEL